MLINPVTLRTSAYLLEEALVALEERTNLLEAKLRARYMSKQRREEVEAARNRCHMAWCHIHDALRAADAQPVQTGADAR